MTIRKADEFEKKNSNVCCIKDCENVASYNSSDGYFQTFFRFGKFWEFERRFCEEHKHLMNSDESESLLDRRKRRWVKPCPCPYCGRQATKEIEIPGGCGGKPWVDVIPVCERHYSSDEEWEQINNNY